MAAEYEGKSLQEIQKEAEADLNSTAAKTGKTAGASDSTVESGVDASVQGKFPGAEVRYGSAASGAGDNREIPLEEGGDINPKTGQPTKARDFEGAGGPETKAAIKEQENPGSDDVRSNVR